MTEQLHPTTGHDESDRFRARVDGGVVHLEGELDLGASEWLREALTNAMESDGPLTLDLSGVSFMDSSGIRVLLSVSAERDVTVVNPSERALSVLDMAGLLERFHIESAQ